MNLLDSFFKFVIMTSGESHSKIEFSDRHYLFIPTLIDGLFSVPAPPFRFLKQNGGVFVVNRHVFDGLDAL